MQINLLVLCRCTYFSSFCPYFSWSVAFVVFKQSAALNTAPSSNCILIQDRISSSMKSLYFLSILMVCCEVLPIDLPKPNQQFREFECIKYFLSNLTDFSSQSRVTLLQLSEAKPFSLQYAFLANEIGNNSIAVKFVQQVQEQFNKRSTYIMFISTIEIDFLKKFLSQAKGFFHIIFERKKFQTENQFIIQVQQMFELNHYVGVDLNLFLHLKIDERWTLYKSVRMNGPSFELLAIGDCVAKDDKVFHVMSSNCAPFISFSEQNGLYSGIENSLLRLISEKLQKTIRYEYLNSIAYRDVLQQIIHGNLSETFQT